MATTIQFTLSPILDKTGFNSIIQEVQNGTSKIQFTPVKIDSSTFDGVKKESEKAGKDASDKFGTSFTTGFKQATSTLESATKNALSPILAVFGGNLLTKGFTSITGGFGDMVQAGKNVLANTNSMRIAFAQTGKTGEQLDNAINSTNKVAGKLANTFGLTVGEVREYSKAAAVLGGATGKSNEDLTKLGIAIEKSTNGLVSGTQAIRLFSKGVSDPESEFALARLSKQYPALGTALKGLKEPAEVTQKALSFFAPTFKEMESQTKGALGSFTVLQNSLNSVKTAFGSIIIEAIAPFASAFANTIVPAVQSFVGYVKGFSGLLQPLAPLFIAVGTGVGIMVTALLGLQGVNYVSGLVSQGIQLAQTTLTQVLPSLFAQTTAQGELIFSTNALTVSNIQQMVATKAKAVADFIQLGATNALIVAQTAFNAVLSANPIALAIAGAVALGGALYLLYDNVESVRNVFDNAWKIISFGAETAWNVIKEFGSVLFEIGSLVFTAMTVPFQISWGIISGIGSVIGSIFGETLGFGTDLTSIFNAISGVGNSVINIFNQVKAVIAGVTAVVGTVVDTVSTGVSQLLSLDFGGFIDTVSNAGDNASKAFSETFNAKMRTAKFDEAKKSIETQLSQGEGINAKIKAKVDFSETVKQYELVQKQIEELSAKKSSGVISAEDSKKLDELQKSAQKYATDIQKIAPETVKSFKAVIDANGNITNSYDINIAKAKEFATANDYTETLNNQKKAVSDNVSSMANTYSQQTDVVKKLQAELAKPVTDEKAYIKLKESFAEAQAQAETMKNELVDNFTKAGTAGLLTDNAIKSVAKSLKITNEEAKGKLLASELKSASEAGVITEKQITKLADKYKVSKDEVRQIFEKQKAITAETLKTQQATEGWNTALDRIKDAQSKALNAVKDAQLQYKKGLITKEQLDIITAESEAKISSANKEIKVLSDVNKEIAKNKNLQIATVSEAKESTKETTKQAKEQRTAYEILRDKLQLSENELSTEREKTISKREQARLELGLTTSAKQSLIDKKADLATEKSILEQRKLNAKTLIDSAEKSIKDKEKLSTELVKLNDEINKIDSSISKVNIEGLKLEADLTLNDTEFKNKLAQSKLDVSRETLEFKIKIGEVPQSELIKFDLTNKIFNKDKLTKDLKEANDLLQKNLSAGLDVTDILASIDLISAAQKKAITDEYNLRKQLDNQQAQEKVDAIADTNKKALEQSLLDAKKVYEEDLALSLGSTELKQKALEKYNIAVNKAHLKHLSDTNILVKSTQLLASGMQNILFKVSSQGVNEAKKTLGEIEKSIVDLRNSYANGSIEYDEYQKKLTELQSKESDARIQLEKAEAEIRSQIWKQYNSVISNVFGEIATTYQDKFIKSLTDANATLGETMTNLAVMSGAMFGQLVVDGENMGRALLRTSLGVLKAMVPYFVTLITGYSLATPDSIATLGASGLIKAGLITAALYGVLGLAESALQGAFKDGVVNFKGKGTGTSDSNAVLISDGESIVTSKASSVPINQKYMSYMNKTGGDLYGFIKANPNIKNEIISDDLKKYYSNIELQKIQLNQLIMEREKSEKLVNEIQKDRIMLQKQLKEINETLKTTKLINSQHAYNIVATNNVVQSVKSIDMFTR